MAAPHVAGAAALYAAMHPGETPSGVKAALQAAGNLGWNNSDDGDSIKEILLNAGSF
jgi:subtilisin